MFNKSTVECKKTVCHKSELNRKAKKLNVQYIILLLNAVYELIANFFIYQLILTI